MKFTKEEGLDHAHLEQEGPAPHGCQTMAQPRSSASRVGLL